MKTNRLLTVSKCADHVQRISPHLYYCAQLDWSIGCHGNRVKTCDFSRFLRIFIDTNFSRPLELLGYSTEVYDIGAVVYSWKFGNVSAFKIFRYTPYNLVYSRPSCKPSGLLRDPASRPRISLNLTNSVCVCVCVSVCFGQPASLDG